MTASRIERRLADARSALGRRAQPHDLAGILASGGLVVDTRFAAQRERDGTIPGSIIVERNHLEWRLDPTSAHRIAEVTGRDQVVVVVCDEGYASSLAAESLRGLGLERATDLDGGFQAWRRWVERAELAGDERRARVEGRSGQQ